MSKKFDSIMIVACEVPLSIKNEIRKIPANVKVKKIDRNFNTFNKVKLLISKNTNNNYFDSRADSLYKKLFLKYFISKSSSILKDILEDDEINKFISKSSEIVYYSYWFFVTALIMVNVSEKFPSNNKLLISRAHRYDLYEEENKLKYLPLREYLLKNIDYIFPVSKNGTSVLRKDFPKYYDKIITSYLGTIDHGYSTMVEKKEFLIVSVSRIEAVKRIDKIVESLALIDDIPDIKWVHFGSGSEEKIVKDLAQKKLKGIKFDFKGAVQNDDILKFYKENDVSLFLNASSSEGIPVAIMEASSFGIPVIATNVGGTSEIIINDKYLIDKEFQPIELSNKIEEMINYKKTFSNYLELRKEVRNKWENNFNSYTNYSDFYLKVKNELDTKKL
ncbi:glycosyltransferase [Floricoccus tropicus]|nr:glycosyltransferase [Floricoccus tropicus]